MIKQKRNILFVFFKIFIMLALWAFQADCAWSDQTMRNQFNIKIENSDTVVIPTNQGKTILLINIQPYQEMILEHSKDKLADIYLSLALENAAKFLSMPDNSGRQEIEVLLANIEDMNEYGQGKGDWKKLAKFQIVADANSATVIKSTFEDKKLQNTADAIITVALPWQEISNLWTEDAINFWLPENIYMIAGIKHTLFFENLIGLENAEHIRFLPEGQALAIGEINRLGIVFTPTEENIGQYKLKITLLDWEHNFIAEAHTTIHVSSALPSSVKRVEPLNILMVGHCSVDNLLTYYIADFMSNPGNPPFKMLGTSPYRVGIPADTINNPDISTIFHEGSGQFDIANLLRYYDPGNPVAPGVPDQSPFVFKKDEDDSVSFDFKRYINEALAGIPPNLIIINVGDNIVFTDLTEEAAERYIKDVDYFLMQLKQDAPAAAIAYLLPHTYNYNALSFEQNYKGLFPRAQSIKNRAKFIGMMREVMQLHPDVALLPTNLVVDPIFGYVQGSAAHMNPYGFRQFAEAVYAWIKFAILNEAS